MLLQKNADLKDAGAFCISKRRRNVVSGNVISAAAYHGNAKLLKFVLTRMDIGMYGNIAALETSGKGSGSFVQELSGYTPLMLACVGDKSNLETVKVLLSAGATFATRDREGSNILHLTAKFGKNNVLEYLVKNLPADYLFERNQKGETPLTICEQAKDEQGIALLEGLQVQYDRSNQKAGDLLDFLEAEEEREKREKAKRKEKKYLNKVSKIAKKEGISTD
jgi:hypothetical protein